MRACRRAGWLDKSAWRLSFSEYLFVSDASAIVLRHYDTMR